MRKKKVETIGEKCIRFVHTYCLVPEGSQVGQPMRLEPFQQQFFLDVFDNQSKTRTAIYSVARKNGKSALVAAILLLFIVGPLRRQGAQLASGAMSRDQAGIVFNLASKMLDMQPAFQGLYRIIPSSKRIVGLKADTTYRALAADGPTAHGMSLYLALLDEAGQVRGPMTPFIEAMLSSQGAHTDPLTIILSTQAPSDADFLSLRIDDARRSGDPHTVCHVYEADKDCDLMDKSQWKKANPALGLFRSEKDLEEQLKMAGRIPSMEGSARNLLLNQRVSLDSLWLAPTVWKANSAAPDIDVFRANGAHIGLDLSNRNDLTAAVLAAIDDDGFIHLMPFVFAPATGMEDRERRDKAPYTAWVRDGSLVAVPGATVDYEWVCQFLKGKLDDLGIEPMSIQFDRWRIKEFKSAADRSGLCLPESSWQEVGQGYKDFSPRIESFEGGLLKNKIRHGGHPLLNLGAAHAVVVRDPAGNRKIAKDKSTQRIDVLVASLMAAHPLLAQTTAEFDIGAMIA